MLFGRLVPSLPGGQRAASPAILRPVAAALQGLRGALGTAPAEGFAQRGTLGGIFVSLHGCPEGVGSGREVIRVCLEIRRLERRLGVTRCALGMGVVGPP